MLIEAYWSTFLFHKVWFRKTWSNHMVYIKRSHWEVVQGARLASISLNAWTVSRPKNLLFKWHLQTPEYNNNADLPIIASIDLLYNAPSNLSDSTWSSMQPSGLQCFGSFLGTITPFHSEGGTKAQLGRMEKCWRRSNEKGVTEDLHAVFL